MTKVVVPPRFDQQLIWVYQGLRANLSGPPRVNVTLPRPSRGLTLPQLDLGRWYRTQSCRFHRGACL